MGRMFKAIFCCVSAAAILSGMRANVALAGTGSYSAAEEKVDLKLKLNGFIKPHCSIDIPDNKLWFYIYDEAGQASTDFSVNCNQPLQVEITSLYGGLRHTAFDRIPDYPGFSEFVPYDMAFSVNVPNAKTLKFDSEHVQTTPGGGSINVIPYSAEGTLDLSWSPTEPLIAGEYSDVIEIRVTGDGGSNGRW